MSYSSYHLRKHERTDSVWVCWSQAVPFKLFTSHVYELVIGNWRREARPSSTALQITRRKWHLPFNVLHQMTSFALRDSISGALGVRMHVSHTFIATHSQANLFAGSQTHLIRTHFPTAASSPSGPKNMPPFPSLEYTLKPPLNFMFPHLLWPQLHFLCSWNKSTTQDGIQNNLFMDFFLVGAETISFVDLLISSSDRSSTNV